MQTTDLLVPIMLPVPLVVRSVNAYLLRTDPPTLIDCGLDASICRETLFTALGAAGCPAHRIGRVLLTHAHGDHCGLAGWFQAQGARLYCHRAEFGRLRNEQWWLDGREAILQACGVPARLRAQEDVYQREGHRYVLPLDAAPQGLADNERLSLGSGCTLRVILAPGHSQGHVAFWWEEGRELVSGDQLLPRTSSNPLFEPLPGGGRAPALSQLLASYDRLGALPARITWPGHGTAIVDHRDLITERLALHRLRLSQIAAALPAESTTAYQLAVRLFPQQRGHGLVLAVSEILAHLDLLVHEGRAAVCERRSRLFWRPAPA